VSGQGRLSHKRVITTGAASGIGEASARLYAAEGASLVMADIDPKGASLARELVAKRWLVRDDVDVRGCPAEPSNRRGGGHRCRRSSGEPGLSTGGGCHEVDPERRSQSAWGGEAALTDDASAAQVALGVTTRAGTSIEEGEGG
jgi:NAD(P)-dependent dehydrogenase (short-subunit alcohol dehydrogenase family)